MLIKAIQYYRAILRTFTNYYRNSYFGHIGYTNKVRKQNLLLLLIHLEMLRMIWVQKVLTQSVSTVPNLGPDLKEKVFRGIWLLRTRETANKNYLNYGYILNQRKNAF